MKVCLSVGGSDSCAGAGIQADLLTFQSFDVPACSAITALTAQNPKRISSILPTNIQHFRAELEAVFDYYDVGVVKTGMLVGAKHIEVLLDVLQQQHQHKTLLVDPVLVASSGKCLLDEQALSMLQLLCQQATLVTPNLAEMAVLSQDVSQDYVSMALRMAKQWQNDVLLKGGHTDAHILKDILVSAQGSVTQFKHHKLEITQRHAHGTGCRLASAIAALLLKGLSLPCAVRDAIAWLHNSLLEFNLDEGKGVKYVE